MTSEVATYLKNKLLNLNFIDTISGLVYVVRQPFESGEDGKPGEHRFPVSTDAIINDCFSGAQVPMIPDSSKKGLLYFEDLGSQIISSHRGMTSFASRLTLVCWINRDNVTGQPFTSIVQPAITQITKQILSVNPVNHPPFTTLVVKLESVAIRDANIFAKYTYPEDVTQYLMPPFDYFALNLSCTYKVSNACAVPIIINPALCSTS